MIHGLSQMYSLGGALYNFVLLLAFGGIISSIPNLCKILETATNDFINPFMPGGPKINLLFFDFLRLIAKI